MLAQRESNRGERLEIRSDFLLLVEGRDEVLLFQALIKHCSRAEPLIQVIEAGGKDQFPRRIKAIYTAIRARPSVRALAVVRDADENAESAFQSVRDQLRNVGLEAANSPNVHSNSDPSVGVFIVPDGVRPGAVETLCRESVQNSDSAECVDIYLDCLKERRALHSKNQDKSFVHAFLAAKKEPLSRVGEAAQRGVWDFDSPAFEPLVHFIGNMK